MLSQVGVSPAMRIDLGMSLFLLVVALSTTPAFSQESGSSGPGNLHPTILDVQVTETPDSVDVVVKFNRLVQPEVRRLDHPDRLIFNFPGCELGVQGQRFVVSQQYLLAVNTAASSSVSHGASVVIDLAPPRRDSASGAKKLVVSLNAAGNDLIIKFGANEHVAHPALASGGGESAPRSLPSPASGRQADRVVAKREVPAPMPSLPPVALGTNRRTPKTQELVVPPTPGIANLVSRSDRTSPKVPEAVPPTASPLSLAVGTEQETRASVQAMPSMPATGLRPNRGTPETAEIVPATPSLPVIASRSEQMMPHLPEAIPPRSIGSESIRTGDRVPPTPTGALPTLVSPRIVQSASRQPHAYALLDKARSLNVADLEPLEAKAEAGEPESETMLALAYHAGTLLKVDDAEALSLLRRAANGGFVAAEEAMGIFCQSGFGMPPDKAQAVSWYTKAAEHGSTDAATNLAWMYATGDGITKDSAKAAIWFRAAAEAGDATAQLNLAGLYHRGDVLPQDDTQAFFYLSKAADQGLLPAMLELARWYLHRNHGGDVDAAIDWFEKAANLGDATAQLALGDVFIDQKLSRLDYSKAVYWYRKAAEQNIPDGQYGLGARYLLGQGVPQDMEEARRWLTPAANRGHPYAQFLLANMLEKGDGGPVDVATAVKYYESAANYGIAQAQYRLGLLLAADRKNNDSLVSAYKWLVLAQDVLKQSSTAPEQELRNQLTPSQLVQAENEIAEWRTAHFPRQQNR